MKLPVFSTLPLAAAGAVILLAGCSAPAAQPTPAAGSSQPAQSTAVVDEAETASATPSTSSPDGQPGIIEPSPAAPDGDAAEKKDWKKAADGHWCHFPMDEGGNACWKIAYPKLTYDTGDSVDLDVHGGPTRSGGGVVEYPMQDAPLGTFYPAGKHIPRDPECGTISQDRMWSEQAGDCMLRQEDIAKNR